MKKLISVLVLFLFLNNYLLAQTPPWTWASNANHSLGGDGDIDATVIDGNNNIYATGSFAGTMVLGTDTLIAVGGRDFFIVKYNPTGLILWARSAGSGYPDNGSAITVDASNNVYVAGYFAQPSINFAGIVLPNSGLGSSSKDVFLVKYNSSGVVQWAKKSSGNYDETPTSIKIDGNNRLYMCGYFSSATLTLGATVLNNPGIPFQDAPGFIAKYNLNGAVQWVKVFGGPDNFSSAYPTCLAIDTGNNVYMAGNSNDSIINFGGISLLNPSYSNFPNSYNGNVYLTKLNSSGTYISAMAIANDSLWCGSITIDGFGNVIMLGEFLGQTLSIGSTVLTNSHSLSQDIFITKINPSGNIQWARKAGGNLDDMSIGYYAYSEPNRIVCDGANNILITGYYNSPTMNFGGVTISKPATDTTNFYVAKYSNSGNIIWALNGGSAWRDFGNSVSVNNSGEIFIAGVFADSAIHFGSTTLHSLGANSWSGFIAKLGSCNLSNPVISLVGMNLQSSPALTYQWYLNNLILGGDTTQIISPTQNGHYTVVISDSNGCIATSNFYNYNLLEVQGINFSNSISIFPNPTIDGNFTVLFQEQNHEIKFSVTNLLGQKIIDETILPAGIGEINLNLKNEAAGIYFLRIEEEGNSYAKKLVLE